MNFNKNCPLHFRFLHITSIFLFLSPGFRSHSMAVRNLSFTVTEFNLFTAYNAPGQENITDEDDKEKIMVQPIIESIEMCTKEQLQDIVNGWMRHIEKAFKLYEQKVFRIVVLVPIEFPMNESMNECLSTQASNISIRKCVRIFFPSTSFLFFSSFHSETRR